jgi:hypothetical protein
VTAKTKTEANNETTALVPVAPDNPAREIATVACSWVNVRTMADAIQVAELIGKSNSYPKIKNAGQALAIMMTGAEMGFGVAASLAGIHIIEGNPVIGAHLKAASIRSSGRYDYEVTTEPGREREYSSVEFYAILSNKTRKLLGTIVEVLDQVAPSLRKKPNWLNHPDDMLFATAINKGFRRYTPDLTGGVSSYDEDEIANEPTGNVKVIEAETTPAPVRIDPPVPVRQFASEEQVELLSQLEMATGTSQEVRESWFERAKVKRGEKVDEYKDLHPDDAAALIGMLEKKVAASQPKQEATAG